jgi:hypothetical protein
VLHRVIAAPAFGHLLDVAAVGVHGAGEIVDLPIDEVLEAAGLGQREEDGGPCGEAVGLVKRPDGHPVAALVVGLPAGLEELASAVDLGGTQQGDDERKGE